MGNYLFYRRRQGKNLADLYAIGVPVLDTVQADPASDDFNRADESPLTYPWVPTPGATGTLVLTGSAITASASGGSWDSLTGTWDDLSTIYPTWDSLVGEATYYYDLVTPGANQFSEATMTTVGATGDGGVLVRITDTGSTLECYFGRVDTSGAVIYKHGAGGWALVNSGSGTVLAGDVIRLEAVGSTLTLKRNGITLVTGTDTTYSTGRVGVRVAESTTSLDDWSGGTLAPSGRITKNTRAWPLGVEIGMHWRVPV